MWLLHPSSFAPRGALQDGDSLYSQAACEKKETRRRAVVHASKPTYRHEFDSMSQSTMFLDWGFRGRVSFVMKWQQSTGKIALNYCSWYRNVGCHRSDIYNGIPGEKKQNKTKTRTVRICTTLRRRSEKCTLILGMHRFPYNGVTFLGVNGFIRSSENVMGTQAINWKENQLCD